MTNPGKRDRLGPLLVGWQEWCNLPKLRLPALKAKLDTGAKTSALHAESIRIFRRNKERFVRFTVCPLQKNTEIQRTCTARVVGQKTIMSSTGHKEKRWIIRTPVRLGPLAWEVEISLTNRDPLSFRMLLGRDALKRQVLIDPSKTMLTRTLHPEDLQRLYAKDPIPPPDN